MFAKVGGKTILARVVGTFQKCSAVDQVILVVNQQSVDKVRQLVAENHWDKITEVCVGGKRRQDSVAAGIKQLKNCDWVIIHDGARPLVTRELIERGLEAAQETGAAVAAVPVTDTIKVAGDDRIVLETLPRQNLWAAQTPQVFRYSLIAEAYKRAKGEATDDASLVEQAGYKVKLYMGAYDNIKVTTKNDLLIAETLQKHGK